MGRPEIKASPEIVIAWPFLARIKVSLPASLYDSALSEWQSPKFGLYANALELGLLSEEFSVTTYVKVKWRQMVSYCGKLGIFRSFGW